MAHIESSRKAADTLRRVADQAKGLEPEAAIKAFDEAEFSLSPLVSASQELALELRRRVAEGKFMSLSSRDPNFVRLLSLHDNLVALGFSDLQKEFTAAVLFADVCRRFEERVHLKALLRRLRSRLDEAEHEYDAEVLHDLRDTLHRLEQD